MYSHRLSVNDLQAFAQEVVNQLEVMRPGRMARAGFRWRPLVEVRERLSDGNLTYCLSWDEVPRADDVRKIA